MNFFPAVDPIPLPAPVWLFKALHIVTMALHFIAVEMLLGGLLAAICLNFLGVSRRMQSTAQVRLAASAAMARRLPIIMTYVINLGVPPLLFAQVLYGRALYTSSVLVGVYWISVIVLLTLAYWLLYRFSAAAESGRVAWPLGLMAWLLTASIAKIYTTNMTLMLRPEVWIQMYGASPVGAHLPPHDPTTMPRWLFMMAGGLVFAGLWMLWLASRQSLETPVQNYLSTRGGRLALIMVLIQAALGYWVFKMQPDAVRTGLAQTGLYAMAGYIWLGAAALVFLLGTTAGLLKKASVARSWLALTFGFFAALGMTVYRDGIRDLNLAGHGFNVFDRAVATNWPVVGLFLVLFVAGLAVVGWLILVVSRARPITERITHEQI
jgi:hypothetical protein